MSSRAGATVESMETIRRKVRRRVVGVKKGEEQSREGLEEA